MTDFIPHDACHSIQQQARIFREIGRILTSSLNPGEVFQRVMKLIGEYFSPRNWSLLMLDEKTGELKFEIVMGVDADKLKKINISKGEGIAGWVCASGQPAVVEDVSRDQRFSPMIDPLTGIYNRYYFNDVLQREARRIRRFGYSICVLMMDVDGLKAINDRHGHMTGDVVLRHIAEILHPGGGYAGPLRRG